MDPGAGLNDGQQRLAGGGPPRDCLASDSDFAITWRNEIVARGIKAEIRRQREKSRGW